MKLDYIKLSPTENITVLVTTPVPRARQAALAARLLAGDVVGGEQAGYVEPPSDPRAAARLQMMGGEFCGNAAMALGAVLARRDGAARADWLIEVSGSDALVPCRVRRDGDGWVGTVRMPLPTRIGKATVATDGGPLTAPLVEMPGIAHLILPSASGPAEAELRRRLPEWNRAIGADALGALLWDAGASSIDPLVYVPSAGTLVRERGCGSGSAAVGCWLAARAGGSLSIAVRQPGGVIEVEAAVEHGALTAVSITGRVTLVGEGAVEIDG